jgi:prepilin-type N-terminal cleavage/methylation domain-containing protein
MRMNRRGFTMIELAITLVVLAIMTGMAITGVGAAMQRARVDRAASVVAADMEQAFSIAGRLRRPVRIYFDEDTHSYQVVDALNTSTVRLTRSLALETDYGVEEFDYQADESPAEDFLTILPPGRSNSRIEVTIGSGERERRITVSTAGFVRVLTP